MENNEIQMGDWVYRGPTQYKLNIGWNTNESGFLYTQIEYIWESLNTTEKLKYNEGGFMDT